MDAEQRKLATYYQIVYNKQKRGYKNISGKTSAKSLKVSKLYVFYIRNSFFRVGGAYGYIGTRY